MRIIGYILSTAFMLASFVGAGQDLHFSHFDKNPLYINPAMAGKFNGKYKLMSIARNQWNTVTVPYRSFGAMAEFSQIVDGSPIGSAFSLYRDVAGDSRFTTTKLDVGLSYSVSVNYNRTSVVAFGLQAGMHHYGLDYSQLSWDNQYDNDSGFNPGLPSRESTEFQSIFAPSASAGVAFIKQRGRYTFIGGVGAYNLLRGNLSFSRIGVEEVKQNIRLNYYGSMEILSGKFVFVPTLLRTQSSVLHESIVGFKTRYQPDAYLPELSLGVMYRWKDAFVLTTGAAYGPWEAGFSFDINTSNLVRASNGYGAVEFFISYVGQSTKRAVKRKNRFQVCPTYI
ncbi:PorP/SprF family type IX secretion system membrane protein [Luteibaculum oceani]|uniref:Type IX secretion system membrane protein PorP/SprF n=1 Tax=Luteibaculum oceani TaxID=1294296 RepID=A0A5C6V182_9FLAO|nr:PorP/SprF family type IX secretion system membrane protein [Luteibaculum oceani]TXC77048.1 type IX secretion system membrane protein PorP/SprF [Luteibaculum oceani]